MLYGRAHELASLERLVHGVRASCSGVLMLRGEPGVGKSALIAHAVERTGDLRVLRGAGVESNSKLPFAGLHRLLRPAFDHVPDLPQRQVEALGSMFGASSSDEMTQPTAERVLDRLKQFGE